MPELSCIIAKIFDWEDPMARMTILALTMLGMVGVQSCGQVETSSNRAVITEESVVGNWKLSYTWNGRTEPRMLKLVNFADKRVFIPGGQPGGARDAFMGTWSVEGNTITWQLADATFVGSANSGGTVSGTMKSKANQGLFNGCQGLDCVPAGVVTGECRVNADCEPGQICEDGTCVVPNAYPSRDAGKCRSNADCAEDQFCDDGTCIYANMFPTKPGRTCSATVDCGRGMVCEDGQCAWPKAAPDVRACRVNTDCDFGELCVRGVCVVPNAYPNP
jgi:hypothetical protein